jgi:predicted  nucleic acid-binding Zn-ribbon protein
MPLTPYHAKYFAHELTRLGGSGVERLGRSLFDASVQLQPHQIDAALFALKSPLEKGVILADEVGLGKTIEAGLVMCQLWAEKKRHILVICPAALRKQWEAELMDKFNLPARVIDARSYRVLRSEGSTEPFLTDQVVICSFHYASRKATELQAVPWDLVVIDEAHKLRNAYRESATMANNLRQALADRKKLLLTATPLQNSLLELYGLSTLIDENLFGDLPSFKTQYTSAQANLAELRERIQPFVKRTLRSQVLEYIAYTERKLITKNFTPTDEEHQLYEAVSTYLQRPGNYALPKGQRHLIVLLVRKVLASSARAVAGTLAVLRDRLERMLDGLPPEQDIVDRLINDEELGDELIAELLEDQEDADIEDAAEEEENGEAPIDRAKLQAEIEELGTYIRWAQSIGVDTKSRALLQALQVGFERMKDMGARPKAVVFTESRRTQLFLKDFLEANGHAGEVLTFNGTNREPESSVLMERWRETHDTASRDVDVRSAILDAFKNEHKILIATEAAAEGLNLQFCSLVINYDLPWNPQRIEQRIGRCHRFGQEFDVVVINFLNARNEADQRVYELLDHKFNLFNGVFGASDSVLGSIEGAVDFERRVLDIYQTCRTPEEIQRAFAALRKDVEDSIARRMARTEELLVEHFDEDVHARLKLDLQHAQQRLDAITRQFWGLTQWALDKDATFADQELSFHLLRSPLPQVPVGHYQLIRKDQEAPRGYRTYRLGHPLGEHVIAQGKTAATPAREVVFDYSHHGTRISLVEQLKGKRGYLLLQRLRVKSVEEEDHLLFTAATDDGQPLDQETCAKLFLCAARVEQPVDLAPAQDERLKADAQQLVRATLDRIMEANNRHFLEAREKLHQWARDREKSAERELDEAKAKIRELERKARQASTMAEQHEVEREIANWEKRKRDLRQRIFQVEDEIAEKRDRLINALVQKMQQTSRTETLFAIRWRVV